MYTLFICVHISFKSCRRNQKRGGSMLFFWGGGACLSIYEQLYTSSTPLPTAYVGYVSQLIRWANDCLCKINC